MSSVSVRTGRPATAMRFSTVTKQSAPLFDDDRVALHAEETQTGGLKGWTAREGGPVATLGEADWN